jgi:NADH-quinone oxidoreductase subunit F
MRTGFQHRPLLLVAELTHRCPLHCVYCSNPLALQPAGDELATEEWSRVFREAASLGIFQLSLTGGEPLARRDLPQLVAAASAAKLYVNLITSGVGLTEQRLAELVDAGVEHLQLSFQDVDEAAANTIAGARAHAHKLALATLVKKFPIAFTVNLVVHRQNLDRLEAMIAMAEDLAPDRLEIAHVQYYGWALRNRKLLMPTADQVVRSVPIIAAAKERLRGRIQVESVTPDYYAQYPKPCVGGSAFVPKESAKPKYVLCNGDESEPGTCKDRLIFEHDPHSVIEGVMIASLAVGSHTGYIYIRGEYRYLSIIMQKAIKDAYAKGFLGKNIFGSGYDLDIYWHGGAGAYEVGEESALMESLEGKRGIPRIRPPFPAIVGLWGGPTVINNAETLAAVPHIILGGADWYAKLGAPKNGGTRLFCLAGNLNKPGVYELPMGYNLKKMIYEVGGGIPNGRSLKAVVPGGSSTPVLLPEEIDVAMDFDSVAKAGSMLGSGGVVVLDDTACIVKFALRTMKFYRHESCGWCIPCREGTDWLEKTLTRFHAGAGVKKDIDNIYYLAENMLGKTFCPLGDAAAMPTMAFVKKFRKEFEDHLDGKPCPFEKAAEPVLV